MQAHIIDVQSFAFQNVVKYAMFFFQAQVKAGTWGLSDTPERLPQEDKPTNEPPCPCNRS